jgi:radical SAM superfamily enzyme YgiQ (UPF0313 family)
MKIDALLISPDSPGRGINRATIEPPLGILYIASFLESKGFSCEVIDAYACALEDSEVIKKAVAASPLLVGLSTNAFNYNRALRYAREIKEKIPDTTVILGGPQPTAIPELCLENPAIDGVVCGEGEFATYEILENLKNSRHPFKTVNGVTYRNSGRITRTPPRTRIIDIDKLPFPAYHLLPSLKHYRGYTRKPPFMGIITSRGCPYNCTFCSKNIFGNKITLRNPENVVSEIEFLVRDMQIRQIDILDDNFAFDMDRCRKICDLLIKRPSKVLINLQTGIRVDSVDKELMLLLKKAGVFKISFGVETGDEDVLGTIGKSINLEAVLNASKWARESGMIVTGFFMIGLPHDTRKTLQKTIDFAKKMNPHIANFMITIPFYGTPLYGLIEKKGKFLIDTKRGISSGYYGAKAFFELEGLKKDIIEYFYKKAYRDFYFRIGKLIDILGALRSWAELKWLLSNTFGILMTK